LPSSASTFAETRARPRDRSGALAALIEESERKASGPCRPESSGNTASLELCQRFGFPSSGNQGRESAPCQGVGATWCCWSGGVRSPGLGGLLLRHAVQRPQAHTRSRQGTRSLRGQGTIAPEYSTPRDPARIAEDGHANQPVGDIEVGVARGEQLSSEIHGFRAGQCDHAKVAPLRNRSRFSLRGSWLVLDLLGSTRRPP